MIDNSKTSTLEILDWNGNPRVATARPSSHDALGQEDPAWHLADTGNAEWLQYLADDGAKWQCKIHCTADTVHLVKFWLEHKRQDGSGGHDSGKNGADGGLVILFLDHQRRRWGAYNNIFPDKTPPVFTTRYLPR